ncbi:MAG: hypothetical protein GY913_34750 [Proteobacteria bacterium]|nr:hypothetical protein [Pseudomonadota bacterium]MCP4922089.1 hypothetical protein [Pseudomonadota bacterium]
MPPIAMEPAEGLTGLGARPLLVMARYPRVASKSGRELAYEEGALFTPALLGLRPGVDTVWIRPESMMAELMGREHFGLQKRQARVDFGDRLTRFGDSSNDLELSWDRTEPAETLPVLHELADHLTPIPLASGLLPALATDWLTERLSAPTMIFSRVPTRRPSEHRLVASSFESKAPRNARRLHGVRLWTGARSELRGARVLYGCELTLEFTLSTPGTT